MFKKNHSENLDELEPAVEPTIDSRADDNEQEVSRSEPAARSVSYLGAGLQLTGDIVAEENLVIEGQAECSINCVDKQLTVGKNGRVVGRIVGSVIDLRGKVEGEIYSHEIVRLYSTAVVEGSIFCKRLIVDENAAFNGKVDMNWDGTLPKEKPKSAAKAKKNVVEAVR